MTSDNNDTPHENRRICWNCIQESYLRSEVKRKGKLAICDYCKCRKKSMCLADLANQVETIILRHFCRAASEPNWEPKGQPIQELIADISKIEEKPASDVLQILQEKHYDRALAETGEEGPFDEEAHYNKVAAVDDNSLRGEWNLILQSLQQESRLFNQRVADFLETVFNKLDTITTHSGESVVVAAGPETSISSIFRARVFQSDQDLEYAMKRPDRELGPPPSQVANAGRMNSRGIAVFYGATDMKVALAETRPPVGSAVLIGCFILIRPLRLIDITALEAIATVHSFFDPTFQTAALQKTFLHYLSRQMTLPVMPSDEASDYLVTQAISEFLASMKTSNYDGIIYPSVQSASARNVVLFHKASRVQELELPDGTDISVQRFSMYEEDPVKDYIVHEEVSAEAKIPNEDEYENWNLLAFSNASEMVNNDKDMRDPAVRIDAASVHVQTINSVNFETTRHQVSRRRREKTN